MLYRLLLVLVLGLALARPLHADPGTLRIGVRDASRSQSEIATVRTNA